MKENPRSNWDDPIARAVDAMTAEEVAAECAANGIDIEAGLSDLRKSLAFYAEHGVYPSRETLAIL